MSKLTDKEARELWVLLRLREALGDPTGKLMQDELVERARNAWADAERWRWGVKHAAWHRNEERAHIAIPVAADADLSCVAMRVAALDAARGKT